MPTFTIQLPDGREADIDAPEGATEQQVLSFAKQQFDQGGFAPVDPATGIDPNLLKRSPPQVSGELERSRQGPLDIIGGLAETAVSLGSSAVAEPLAGLAGLATAALPGETTGAEAVAATREALTVQPQSFAGREITSAIGEAVEPVAQAFESAGDALGDFAFDLTGSPTVAAAAKTSPAAVIEILGLGAIRKLKSGTKLIDDAGRPTRALQKALDDKGLTFEGLTPEARSQIPAIADKSILPGANEPAKAAEQALVSQIKTGGRDNALAPFKAVGSKIEIDELATKAIKQGFDDGFVQAVKTTDAQTKVGMNKMLNIMERIKKNRSVASQTRPTDIVGDSVTDRIKFIRNTASEARKDLNRIAKNDLPGVELDTAPILSKLEESLDNLNVQLIGEQGTPTPVFRNSLISKDRTSQRVIRDLVDLMGEGGRPDAKRFHELKRQLDIMIDFRKKSAGGLTDAGKKVLKDIRASLNNSLREANPEYAAVNDTLSKSLTALDDFQRVSGSTIDIFGEGSNKAIGQDLRGLMSNRKSRVNLENSVNQIDRVANELGGNFTDNIADLAMFANSIEDRFGAVAQTSLKGEVESAITQGLRQGPRETAFQTAAEAAGRGVEKLRGINEFNAFRAMEDLLRGSE